MTRKTTKQRKITQQQVSRKHSPGKKKRRPVVFIFKPVDSAVDAWEYDVQEDDA